MVYQYGIDTVLYAMERYGMVYQVWYKVPLRDVIDVKPRGCRKLKRANRRSYVYEPIRGSLVLYRRCCCYCCCYTAVVLRESF